VAGTKKQHKGGTAPRGVVDSPGMEFIVAGQTAQGSVWDWGSICLLLAMAQ